MTYFNIKKGDYIFKLFNKKLLIFLQFFIIILLLINSIYNLNFEIKVGDLLSTEDSISKWYFIKNKEYNYKDLSDFIYIKYINIYDIKDNNKTIIKGDIIGFDDFFNEIGIFKGFTKLTEYYYFEESFKKEIIIGNETYAVSIKNNLLELTYYKDCYNSLYLIEWYEKCTLNDETYDMINDFLYVYFSEPLILPNRYIFYEIIYIFFKYNIYFMFFNILLYILIFLAKDIIKKIMKIKNKYHDEYIPIL